MKNFLLLLMCSLFTITLAAQKVEYGLASYYGDEFDGRKTAYGDTYDKTKMTAAHKKFAYGTMIKVTREDNGKSVVVKVTDKGPFVKGRVVDLSRAAAEVIGLIDDGITKVRVEKVESKPTSTAPEKVEKEVVKKTEPAPVKKDVAAPTPKVEKETAPAPKPKVVTTSTPPKPSTTLDKNSKAKPVPAKLDIAKKPVETVKETKASVGTKIGKGFSDYGTYQVKMSTPKAATHTVQVASMTDYRYVMQQVAKYQAKWFDDVLISTERQNGIPLYKINLGAFDSAEAAQNYARSLASKHKIKGFATAIPSDAYYAKMNGKGPKVYGMNKVELLKPPANGFGVQVASLTDMNNAMKEVAVLKSKWFDNVYVKIEDNKGKPAYKIALGWFDSRDAANKYKNDLAKKHRIKGFVIGL